MINIKTHIFPGGELNPTIEEFTNPLVARLQSAEDLVKLILVTEILERHGKKDKLTIPYFPYARQDRIMKDNESFSLKAICNVVNNLNYNEVTIYDPHSDVTPALLNNVKVISQLDCIRNSKLDYDLKNSNIVIISPDAGAYKKANKVAEYYKKDVAVAIKTRDSEGNLSNQQILGDVYNKDCLIIDDICDGGRTFINLVKILKEKGAGDVWLYVTHGIFSQSLNVFDGLITRIYTTDTFLQSQRQSNLFIQEINYAY